jgi:hypothetical protein
MSHLILIDLNRTSYEAFYYAVIAILWYNCETGDIRIDLREVGWECVD